MTVALFLSLCRSPDDQDKRRRSEDRRGEDQGEHKRMRYAFGRIREIDHYFHLSDFVVPYSTVSRL